MITYHVTKTNVLKLYTYRRTVFSHQFETYDAALETAREFLDGLNSGDIEYAHDCAKWFLQFGKHDHVNVSLGPEFYLHLEDRTIRDMTGKIVRTIDISPDDTLHLLALIENHLYDRSFKK